MRPDEWGKYHLQDLCSYITDGKHGDCRNQDDSGFYFLSAKDVSEGRLFYENARQITKEDFEDTNKRTRLEAFDILLTNSGTIGRMAIAEDHELTSRTTFQKSVAILKPIKQKVFPHFLYYCLVSRKYDLVNTASGTTQQNLLLGDLRSFEVEIPEDRETQRHIADILSALDEKVELNRQTNATLEAIAQTIFKEWFVDFNFPGAGGDMVESELGMIPSGWKVLPLDEIANFLNGLALQKYPRGNDHDYLPAIKIRELKNGVTDSSDRVSRNIPEKYIIHDGDLIFSWSGTLEVKFWVGGEGALNQHLFKVTSKEYPLWFCYFWIFNHLEEFRNIAEDKTTTMGHIQRAHLSTALCLVPDNLNQINKMIHPIIEKAINNEKEMLSLAQIRNNLLPKLMSGEIEV